jgi:hypothetical protein
MGKDLEGRSLGLNKLLSWHFYGRTEGSHEKLQKD